MMPVYINAVCGKAFNFIIACLHNKSVSHCYTFLHGGRRKNENVWICFQRHAVSLCRTVLYIIKLMKECVWQSSIGIHTPTNLQKFFFSIQHMSEQCRRKRWQVPSLEWEGRATAYTLCTSRGDIWGGEGTQLSPVTASSKDNWNCPIFLY